MRNEPSVKVEVNIEFSTKAKNRLLRLAKLLRADARRKNGIKFDMGTFLSLKTVESEKDLPKKVALDCGTRACALGLAAISEEFKREGLSYKIVSGWNSLEGEVNADIVFLFQGKRYGGNEMEAASKTFDIPESVAQWLFGGSASKHSTGATAEIEMAEIIESACKGKLPKSIVNDLLDDYES